MEGTGRGHGAAQIDRKRTFKMFVGKLESGEVEVGREGKMTLK